MRVRVQGKWKYMASDPTDDKLHGFLYRCMNCDHDIISSLERTKCPNCFVDGVLVRETIEK